MDKRYIIICFLIIIVLSSSISVEANNSFLEESIRVKAELEKFEEKVSRDLKSSFKIDLENYQEITDMDLAFLAKDDSSLFYLLNIAVGLKKKSIGSPIIYWNPPNKACILVKEKTGKNLQIHFERFDERRWLIVNHRVK